MDEKRKEIKEKLETIIRCAIHKVQVPDSDISMLVDDLTAWIEQEFIIPFKEKDKKIEKLEKIISNGVLKDHDGCQIYHEEEYTKLESKFYTAEARIKELEKIIGYVKNNEIYEVRRLFDDPDKEIERLISHLDLAISAGREGWKKAEELEKGIEDTLKESTISYVVEKRLKELIKKGE